MDFAFTDEQAMIAETAKQFFAEAATSEQTRKAMATNGIDHGCWQAFCNDLGLGGLLFPEALGGSALGMVEFAIIAEAAGAQVAAIPLLGQAMVGCALLASGNNGASGASGDNNLLNSLLPGIISGDIVAAAGEAPELAVDGDRLSGQVSHLPHGNAASLFLLMSDNGVWLVNRDLPGVTVTPRTTMDQTRPLADLSLNAVAATPVANPSAARRKALEAGRICLAAEALGGAQACLDRTVHYAHERVQFGRPIGSFQAYKHRLADMMVEIEQARSALYWAACALDEGTDNPELALHAAKSFCADTFFRCAADMIQLHGGIGFTWEHDAHLFFKRARSIQTQLGNGDWHREQVATMILGGAA